MAVRGAGQRLAGVAGFVLVTQLVAVAVASYADWPARIATTMPSSVPLSISVINLLTNTLSNYSVLLATGT